MYIYKDIYIYIYYIIYTMYAIYSIDIYILCMKNKSQGRKKVFYSHKFLIATSHLTGQSTYTIFSSITLFLCRKVTSRRWSEICSLTYL